MVLINTADVGLPGLRFSDNDFGAILNGSLWSLGPEFACYVGVAALGVLSALGLRTALIVLAIGLYTHWSGDFGGIGYVLPFFAAGAVLHFWKKRPRPGAASVLIAVGGLIAAAWLGRPQIGFALFGSWLIISLATANRQITGATRFGDLSYGMYLYGWPIEQVVRAKLGDGAIWWPTFVIALPLAMLAAFISWHAVEKPSLALAKRLTARPAPAAS